MAKLFSKTEAKSEMTTVDESQYQVYRFSNNVSMKDDGSVIDGIYRGIEVKPYQGIKGTHLYIIHFEKNGQDITFVAGSEVLKFLENFNIGFFLGIKRIHTILTKQGNKYAQYEFQFDPLGVKLNEKFQLYDMKDMPVQLQPPKKEKSEQEV